jgi:DNA-binding response OmpR family regulator
MQVACLIADDSAYAALDEQFREFGLACRRYTSDTGLLRNVTALGLDAAFVDVGWNQPLAERMVSWVQCRGSEHFPLLLQTLGADGGFAARALGAGVDDVIVRGTPPIEIAARLHAAVRRRRGRADERMLKLAGFEFDRYLARATYRGEPIELRPREFELAWLLFLRAGICVSRRTLCAAVWGAEADVTNRTLEQHVHRLRKAMGLGGERGVVIRTAYGIGYKLEVDRAAGIEPVPPPLSGLLVGLGMALV